MNNFGYHIPLNKCIINSVTEVVKHSPITTFQLFIKSTFNYKLSSFTDDYLSIVRDFLCENDYKMVIHGQYTINMSHNNQRNFKIVMDDLSVASRAGMVGVIYHCAKCNSGDTTLSNDDCIENMYNFIVSVIDEMMCLDLNTYFILETSSGQGSEILYKLPDFCAFYNRFTTRQKRYFRVCLDTCHLYSGGCDLNTEEAVNTFIEYIENTISWSSVAVVHLNDSKNKLGAKVDRHETLGEGHIKGLKYVARFISTRPDILCILETPYDKKHVKTMYEIHNEELALIKKWIS